MAHLGRGAGEFLAALERGGPEAGRRAMGMARVLGGIDVEVAEGDGPWRAIGTFDEPGPIAGDLRVLPFEGTGHESHCACGCASRGGTGASAPSRSRASSHRWRLSGWSPPRSSVTAGGHAEARARLLGGNRHLVTHPGDAYRLTFKLPPSEAPLELFLESEGYYYEWMRAEWLDEEDPAMAALALAEPAEALRRLAPAYKAQEPRLEQAFWASRFRK